MTISVFKQPKIILF